MSIEKVFQRMPDLFRPDRAIGLTVTYLFICGQAENDTFQVSIADQTISSNGTTVYSVGDRPVKYVRPRFVSESGGTAAVVTFSVAAA